MDHRDARCRDRPQPVEVQKRRQLSVSFGSCQRQRVVDGRGALACGRRERCTSVGALGQRADLVLEPLLHLVALHCILGRCSRERPQGHEHRVVGEHSRVGGLLSVCRLHPRTECIRDLAGRAVNVLGELNHQHGARVSRPDHRDTFDERGALRLEGLLGGDWVGHLARRVDLQSAEPDAVSATRPAAGSGVLRRKQG
eukprot:6004492-Prymnesium_polylepis.1